MYSQAALYGRILTKLNKILLKKGQKKLETWFVIKYLKPHLPILSQCDEPFIKSFTLQLGKLWVTLCRHGEVSFETSRQSRALVDMVAEKQVADLTKAANSLSSMTDAPIESDRTETSEVTDFKSLEDLVATFAKETEKERIRFPHHYKDATKKFAKNPDNTAVYKKYCPKHCPGKDGERLVGKIVTGFCRVGWNHEDEINHAALSLSAAVLSKDDTKIQQKWKAFKALSQVSTTCQ